MQGKVILITGTSSGFGKLALIRLLEKGHTVIAAMRGGQARLDALFKRELREYSGHLMAVDLHLEQPETFGQARSLIEKKFNGRLDVLINNAGYGLFGALEDQSPDQLRTQMEVNFIGPTLFTRALLPFLRQAKGRIITVSSIAGLHTFPLYGSYCASKFALEAMTESLYYELKPFDVQVSLVEPGGFNTDFSSRSRVFSEGTKNSQSLYFEETQALMNTFNHSRVRLGNPERVARLIVKLCEKDQIPLRNIIGIDARFLSIFAKLVPRSWVVKMTHSIFQRFVFRPQKLRLNSDQS